MILTNGDSWTGGPTYDDLEDTWPHQMAKKYNVPVKNLAWGGASNQRIFRTTLEYLYSEEVTPTHLIVGWSFIERFEFPNRAGYYSRVTPSACDTFIETGEKIENFESLRKIYYSEMYNEDLLKKEFLMNFLVLQDLCSYKGIKFLNFFSCNPAPFVEHEKVPRSSWISYPPASMARYLRRMDYEITKTLHTSVEGQRHWADIVHSYL